MSRIGYPISQKGDSSFISRELSGKDTFGAQTFFCISGHFEVEIHLSEDLSLIISPSIHIVIKNSENSTSLSIRHNDGCSLPGVALSRPGGAEDGEVGEVVDVALADVVAAALHQHTHQSLSL